MARVERGEGETSHRSEMRWAERKVNIALSYKRANRLSLAVMIHAAAPRSYLVIGVDLCAIEMKGHDRDAQSSHNVLFHLLKLGNRRFKNAHGVCRKSNKLAPSALLRDCGAR